LVKCKFLSSPILPYPKVGSDHCPIILDTKVIEPMGSPLRFEQAWLKSSEREGEQGAENKILKG